MAAEGLPPEAIPPDIYYKCHSKQINSTVFCVFCLDARMMEDM